MKRVLSIILAIIMALPLTFSVASAAPTTLAFNISPVEAAEEATIVLQDSIGQEMEPVDGFNYEVEPGTYTYIVRAPLFVTQMGVVTVDGDTAVDVTLVPTPSGEITLTGLGDEHKNGTNNNAAGRDMELEGSGYIGWIRSEAWIKYANVNLLGGIESLTFNYARNGSGTNMFEIRLAPSGSTFADATTIVQGSRAGSTNGWGAPGYDIVIAPEAVAEHAGGIQDVYVVFTGNEYNFGRTNFTLKPVPEGIQSYDTTFSVRPYDATVTVKELSGETIAPKEEGGKVYNLEEGFYRYSITSEGYETKSELIAVDGSKRVTTVLKPADSNSYETYEAEAGVITDAEIIDDATASGGQKVGGFSGSVALNAINNSFSNIGNVKFTAERETTGVVEVVISYNSSVTVDGEDSIAIRSNDGTVKRVPLNTSGESSVFVDMRAGTNTIFVSNVLSPRVSNGGNAWLDLDCIKINDATTPGSVEPDEGDEPYVRPKNPIITSMFTADPEAHVWEEYPDKLFLYPSHDNYPSAGCDRMDAYHVYSTTNMVDWVDEGEIVRAADVPWRDPADTNVDGRPFMWAPDAAYKDGYYYFYYPMPRNSSNWGGTWETGVMRSRFPHKDFEEIPASETMTENWKGYIEGAGGDGMIDVCVRVFGDRQFLYIGGSQRMFQAELEDDMVTIKEGTWERIPDNVVPSYHEGPSVFEKDGLYYLIYPGGSDSSTGFSGDKFNYCIGETPLGPWVYQDKFFNPTGCDTSHGSVVEFKDKWYMFYHTADLSGDGTLRSVCVDEVTFDEDGAINLFSKTFDGVEQNGPDYVRPEGTIYGADDAVVDGGAVKSADSSAGYDGKVITDLHMSGSTITFSGVDGGTNGSRAMIVFNYSTSDQLPKMGLSVNGFDYKRINFVQTGGRSFFAQDTFTVKKLNPGTENTIVLTGGYGKLNLNYIEVILLDEEEETVEAVWVKDDNGWKYQLADGTFLTNDWQKTDGLWYYLGEDGYLKTDWVLDGGKWYFLDRNTGAMKTGWILDGKWYYLGVDGAMATGWLNDGGDWYFLDETNGTIITGWVQDGADWYFMEYTTGIMATNEWIGGYWVGSDGKWNPAAQR